MKNDKKEKEILMRVGDIQVGTKQEDGSFKNDVVGALYLYSGKDKDGNDYVRASGTIEKPMLSRFFSAFLKLPAQRPVTCPHCQQKVAPGQFCSGCGEKLSK